MADAVDRLPTLRRLRYAAEVVYFTSRLRLAGRTADELAEAENGLQRARGDLRRCPGHRSRLDSQLRDTL